jgi:hypothetical protein
MEMIVRLQARRVAALRVSRKKMCADGIFITKR